MEKPLYFVMNPLHTEYTNVPKYKKETNFDDQYNWYHTMVVYPFHYQQHVDRLARKNTVKH